MSDLLNKPIEEVTFELKSLEDLNKISKIIPGDGDTIINIKLSDERNNFIFKLKNKKKIDRKTLNILRSKEISAFIR